HSPVTVAGQPRIRTGVPVRRPQPRHVAAPAATPPATGSGGVGRGPVDEVVGAHGVDDAAGLDVVAGRLVAAVDLPLHLAGRVGVGVDGEAQIPLQRQLHQLVGRVLALGAAVDLEGGVELGAGREHD